MKLLDDNFEFICRFSGDGGDTFLGLDLFFKKHHRQKLFETVNQVTSINT